MSFVSAFHHIDDDELKPQGRPLGWRKFYNQTDKRCSRCRKIKLLAEFANDRTRNDGKCAYCTKCKYKYNKELRCQA